MRRVLLLVTWIKFLIVLSTLLSSSFYGNAALVAHDFISIQNSLFVPESSELQEDTSALLDSNISVNSIESNIVIVNNVFADPLEQITITVEVENANPFVAFQMDFDIPEGFSFVAGSVALSNRSNGHSLAHNLLNGGTRLRILAFSMSNNEFLGNSGAIVSFNLNTPNLLGQWELQAINVSLTNAYSQNIYTGSQPGTIYLGDVPQYYTLTLMVNPENSGTTSGEGSYQAGEEVEVSSLPMNGYKFEYWTDIDGEVVSTQQNFIFDMPPNDFSITANFSPIQSSYTVFFIVQDINETPILNATITLGSIENQSGVYIFENILAGTYPFSISAPSYLTYNSEVNVVVDLELLVTLEQEQTATYSLNLLVNPVNAGMVTGEGEFEEGASVSISAIPNTGYQFVSWNFISGELLSYQTSLVFTMPPSDIELVANFERIGYDLEVIITPTESGTVEIIPQQEFYFFGDVICLKAHANSDYSFQNWISNGLVIGNEPELYISMPASSFVVYANFVDDESVKYSLNLIPVPFDGGVLLGEGQYNEGESVTIHASANNGFIFSSWVQNENVVSTSTVYTFLMPPADIELIANFAPTYPVVFNLDMTTASSFNPEQDYVFISGLTGWVEPGTDQTLALSRLGNSMTYTISFQIQPGVYEYKYFINSWDGAEWIGEPNRVLHVHNNTNQNDTWGTTSSNTEPIPILNIYPNPFNNWFSIVFPLGYHQFTIINQLGQIITSGLNTGQVEAIEARNWRKGVYILLLKNESGSFLVQKIVKQ